MAEYASCGTVARLVEALVLVQVPWPISGSTLSLGLNCSILCWLLYYTGDMLMLLNVTSYNTIGRTVLFNHGVNTRVRTKSIIIPPDSI